MEIGSFIELDIRNDNDYFQEENQCLARLNSARSGIYHSIRLYNSKTIHIPYYLCSTVETFLSRKGIIIKKYFITKNFEPIIEDYNESEVVLIVNYFGILSDKLLKNFATRFKKAIIDNSAGFFSPPIDSLYNVYSPRKFFGVPDGGYVIGPNASNMTEDYEKDVSSDTACFLFKRIEHGCNDIYKERMLNEDRINSSDILKMSNLTHALLKNIDYNSIKQKRIENFQYAHSLYSNVNLIDPLLYLDKDSVPMIYPLVINDYLLDIKLKENKIYTGRWWKHVTSIVDKKSFEATLSNFMIPLPIDHRYGKDEIKMCYEIIQN